MISCECCLGDTERVTRRGHWPERWECQDCGHIEVVESPDHVRLEQPNTVACAACGHWYQWSVPVPISIFVAGNLAFGYDHRKCRERQNEAREVLLRVLNERIRAY